MPEGAQREKKESNPARINLMLEVAKGDARTKVELPLRLLVMGDFTGAESDTPLAERDTVAVTKDNFDGVMKSLAITTELTVPNRLRPEDEELRVRLAFESLRDFHPEQVARQIPQLNRLVTARTLLQDLRNRVISVGEFRRGLERIVKDPAALAQLSGELDRAMPQDT
jgi:type VI secretion system protein ImpB